MTQRSGTSSVHSPYRARVLRCPARDPRNGFRPLLRNPSDRQPRQRSHRVRTTPTSPKQLRLYTWRTGNSDHAGAARGSSSATYSRYAGRSGAAPPIAERTRTRDSTPSTPRVGRGSRRVIAPLRIEMRLPGWFDCRLHLGMAVLAPPRLGEDDVRAVRTLPAWALDCLRFPSRGESLDPLADSYRCACLYRDIKEFFQRVRCCRIDEYDRPSRSRAMRPTHLPPIIADRLTYALP